jgi:hypothetical protein
MFVVTELPHVRLVTQHVGVLHCGLLLLPVPLHLKIASGLATGASPSQLPHRSGQGEAMFVVTE